MRYRKSISSRTWMFLGILGIVCILCTIVVALYRSNKCKEAFTVNRTVYFNAGGRFGNNVFQYFAAELMKRIYGFKEVQFVDTAPANAHKINDNEFIDILKEYNTKGVAKPLPEGQDIVMQGCFQRSDLLTPHRDFLRGLFTADNCKAINSEYRVCDIANHKAPPHPQYSPQEDIVMHFRLDDFKTHNLGGIFEATALKKMLATLKYRKLFIVCDKLRQDWENTYMSQFADLNPIYVQGSMLDDYVFLKNAQRLVLNASTFAWTAGFLSHASEIHIPQHPRMGPHTNFYLGCFSEGCTPYTNIPLVTT